MTQQIGQLAKSTLGLSLPLKVCRSAAGHYLGTLDPEDGSPCSRESNEYFRTKEEADWALKNGEWTQKSGL